MTRVCQSISGSESVPWQYLGYIDVPLVLLVWQEVEWIQAFAIAE